MSTYVVDERSTKEKVKDWKDRQVQNLKNGLKWVKENPEFGIPVVLVTVKGATKIVSGATRAYTENKLIRFRQRTIYDRSMGRYIELRRPLTDTEALIIEERRQNGERLMPILQSMKLLKRR